MSPLQYQKRPRLQEARRLMLGEGPDAAEAAFRVGHESPSQLSWEYRRIFGASPHQDVAALKCGSSADDLVWLSTSRYAPWLLTCSDGWFLNRDAGGGDGR